MERIEKLKAFLESNPHDSFLQHALALELIKAGNDGGAKEQFLALLGRDPAYMGSYYHLAKLYEREGNGAAAAEWYQKGIDMARASNDLHTLGELRAALDQIDDQ